MQLRPGGLRLRPSSDDICMPNDPSSDSEMYNAFVWRFRANPEMRCSISVHDDDGGGGDGDGGDDNADDDYYHHY